MKIISRVTQLIPACIALASLFVTANVSALQAEISHTYAKRYDHLGRETGTIAPDPDGAGPLMFPITRNLYNSKGQLFKIESGELGRWLDETYQPKFWQDHALLTIFATKEFVYDSFGRKTQEIHRGQDQAPEALVQFSYDESSRVKCKAVRMNKAVYNALPTSACNQSAASVFGPDRISSYTYNVYDQVLVEKRGVGTSLVQNYVTNAYSTPLSLTETGPVLRTQTDANGNKTELQYDNYGRLYRRIYPSKTVLGAVNTADYNEYRYDVNGNLRWEKKRNVTAANATDANAFIYTYDANNRMTFKNGPGANLDVSYNYDLRGLTLSSRFGSDTGLGVTNAFDGFGHLTGSTNNMGSVARTLSYQYDANGNRSRITHPNSTYFEYGFDNLNRVNSLSDQTAALLSVNYKPIGRRDFIQRNTSGARTSYSFNNAGQLSQFSQDLSGTTHDLTNSFQYNPASQISSLTVSNDVFYYTDNANKTGSYIPNGLNQYVSINGTAISYDANGNLTNDGTWTYTYDDENHLTRASSGTTVATLTYDPLGRLFQTAITGSPTTQFLYDGDALVAEYNGGTLMRRYIHGDQVDEPWLMDYVDPLGAVDRRYLHSDHQGSLIAHSNNLAVVKATQSYDVFGIPKTTNTGVDRFGYTGQIWFKELGLNYYKARIYSPTLGRFLQTDPIFYEDQMNMYAYVGNDPANMVDSTGEFAHIAIGAFAGGLISGVAYAMTTDKFSTTDLAINVATGAAIGAVTAAVPGAIAAGSLNFGGKVANIAASIGNATAAGTVGSVANQAATTGAVDPSKALVAGAANATGLAAGSAVAKPAAALATVKTGGTAGLPVTSLKGNTFTVGKVDATSVTSEGMKQGTQDIIGESVSAKAGCEASSEC